MSEKNKKSNSDKNDFCDCAEKYYFYAKNIHKTFGKKIIHIPELFVNKNEILYIQGPSGSGKSTVLNIIAGLEKNDSNYELSLVLNKNHIENLLPSKRKLGFVFQSGALFEHLNVCDNVAYGLVSSGMKKKEARKKASDFLKIFELEGFENRLPQTLSGGERQRTALARTLILQPSLVLLDEPFSALDEPLKKKLREQLSVWQKNLGFTAIMVTHDPNDIQGRKLVMN